MHKKSLEAADALKSSDEEGEGGEHDKTDISDTSSMREQRKSPLTSPTSTSDMTPTKKPKKTADGSPASNSMSPITVSSPVHHSPSATPKSPVEETSRTKENFAVSAPPPRQSSYHMSTTHESAMSQQHPLVHSSHPHPGQIYPPIQPINATPDTDPSEVFRWVNFNREYSSSFIRWIYNFNFNYTLVFCIHFVLIFARILNPSA